MADQIHVFEKAGLGKAPFKFLMAQALPNKSLLEHNPSAYQNQMASLVKSSSGGVGGTCDYCGTAIMNCYLIESANKNTFWVGCECVRKTGDSGLIRVVDKLIAEKAKEARHAKEQAQIEELRAIMNNKEYQEHMETLNHPRKYAGKTMMDYADWMMMNAGTKGKIDLLKALKEILPTD